MKECSINASALAYEHYLDSLGMFIVEGGEGNDLDYLFYDGFHVYCPLSDASNHLKDTGRVWDGKYMVDDFAFFKADLTDDIQLFRIRKFFNLFYLVEKDHLLPDITLWFFTNYGCKQSFVN
ncbi:hypothetical protein [Fibrobacter sp. UWH9]|uniref:hypothetical protein n=1 Tax=Fibrobacter sp. UWH9 TaxID=1896213 RepID=UPI00111504D5|nr:hypothetical protein [Fibrobacter sp. UWH9]